MLSPGGKSPCSVARVSPQSAKRGTTLDFARCVEYRSIAMTVRVR
jgi:hypothetical protein